jgi:hypothetical protein
MATSASAIQGVPTLFQSLTDTAQPATHLNVSSTSIHKRPSDGKGDIELIERDVVHAVDWDADVEQQQQQQQRRRRPAELETIVSVVPSKDSKRIANIQFVALCLTLFVVGWNDGTTGPLLPRIQAVYHVRLV